MKARSGQRALLLGGCALLAAASLAAASFTVTKTADTNDGVCDSDCSLREAIAAANGAAGPHTIAFAIPGAGPRTITPVSNLPPISETVTIDGATQPAYAGIPLIVLRGNNPTTQVGLRFGGPGNCVVRGLTLNGWMGGAIVVASNGNLIEDNYIGTDASGTIAAPNSDGVSLLSGASTITLRGNVISGNDTGIRGVNNSSVRILGNFIGTDRTGTQAVPNTTGILAHDFTDLRIGDDVVGDGNVISGNSQGIVLDGTINGGRILGNRIGVDVTGTVPLGNASHGITLDGSGAGTLFQIGLNIPDANVIAHNGGAGVWVVNGTNVMVTKNSIHSNGGLGIDLGSLGVLPNDALDVDLGANLGQNYPVITLASTSGGFTTIQGVLDSTPLRTYSVEMFSDSTCNGPPPNDHGEGRDYLSVVYLVQTDAAGHAVFQQVVSGPIGAFVTATATDATGSTSEFSPCRPVQGSVTPTPTPSPTRTPTPTLTPGGPTLTPTPTPSPTPIGCGPLASPGNLTASPIYIAPDGAFTLRWTSVGGLLPASGRYDISVSVDGGPRLALPYLAVDAEQPETWEYTRFLSSLLIPTPILVGTTFKFDVVAENSSCNVRSAPSSIATIEVASGLPDVAVSLSVDPELSFGSGEFAVYTAIVVNNGPVAATNILLDPGRTVKLLECDLVPPSKCNIASLQPGQSKTVVFGRSGAAGPSLSVVVSHSQTDRDTFNDSASAHVELVDCDDVFRECPLLVFWKGCVCNSVPCLPPLLSKALSAAATSPLIPFDIDVFYGLRDRIFARTPEGRRYTRLYETHGPEITHLMLQDPILLGEFLPTVKLWEENLRALVHGHGSEAIISAEQAASLNAFLEHLKALGSPALRDTIAREQAALDLPSKVGLTMDQALVAFQQPGCPDPETTLCLDGGRFRATATWRDPQGRAGSGHAKPMTADTGYFWFFSPDNVELNVKVLDGRALNGQWWVFSGSLSNVEYTLTVTDTATGAVKTYTNPPSHFGSFGDTAAFEGGPAGSAPSAAPPPVPSACDTSGNRLCLNHRRFEVEVAWRDFDGGTGSGHAVDLTDDTGYFWFFSPENVELVVKALDGRSINGDFWVFYGALSNVEYTVTVRDKFTGAVRTYVNPSGTFASVGDTTAFAGLSASGHGASPPALDAWSLLLAVCGVRLLRKRR